MRSKIFKSTIVALMALMAAGNTILAQDVPVPAAAPNPAPAAAPLPAPAPAVQPLAPADVIVTPQISVTSPVKVVIAPVKVDLHQLKVELKELNTEIAANVKDIAPQINLSFRDGDESNSVNSNTDVNLVKNYSKTYAVDGNDNVVISNQYGRVTVNTWARNEVKVDVEIKVGAEDNDAAQKALDNITISDSKDGDNVSFRTNIGETKSSWMGIFSGNGGNHHIEINYAIYMPAKNGLVIDNRYGAIELPNMDGKVTINGAYGNFKAGSLAGENTIRVKYGNADIEGVNTCAIDIGYGNLKLGSANKLAANVGYSDVKIGKLHDSGAINIKYGGGLSIDDLDRSVQSLAINASYTNVTIGLSGDENSNFAIVTHYGDFNYDGKPVTITSKNPDDDGKPHFTRSYKGYVGKGGTDKTIDISSNYGNVKFQ